MQMSRRGFLIAAPAVVASASIMPVSAKSLLDVVNSEMRLVGQRCYPGSVGGAKSLFTIDMITREAVKLFTESNAFLKNLDRQYDETFNGQLRVGDTLRIQLPEGAKPSKMFIIQNVGKTDVAITEAAQQRFSATRSAELALRQRYLKDREFFEGPEFAYGKMNARPEWATHGPDAMRYALEDHANDDFVPLDRAPQFVYDKAQRTLVKNPDLLLKIGDELLKASVPVAAAVAVATVIEKNPVISRRFWSK